MAVLPARQPQLRGVIWSADSYLSTVEEKRAVQDKVCRQFDRDVDSGVLSGFSFIIAPWAELLCLRRVFFVSGMCIRVVLGRIHQRAESRVYQEI